VSDWLQYGVDDFSSASLATLGAGDCEDDAIVKYVALHESRIDPDDLRPVIVRNIKRTTVHAVVAVRLDDECLDNAIETRHYYPLFVLEHRGLRNLALRSSNLRELVPHKHFIALALAVSLATTAAAQEISIGVTMGTRGPGASFGVSYSNAFKLMPKTIGGQPVRFITYEDQADAAEAAKNARKPVTEEKVDVLMGSVSLRSTTEVAQVANELKTHLMAPAPVVLTYDKLNAEPRNAAHGPSRCLRP
jgi:Periplasmic binding protein/Bacterial transglutaminase-like cysteine proteinase BTLCP